ncbi:hypothetical protein MOE86_15545 [Bacillus atrophaeus]|uniref:hypothetical protein n=1 Tax=Bacillus atrophaeus TaxID=1452 RepID=UPI00227F2175|nr:hypothetical protein [Bacillus atrophaeus]MCY9198092.1 hypothetical protein [Bacillus atrophaeus]
MTLPKQIMINSIPYKVLQVDGFIEEDQKGGVQLGDINPWKQEIQVSKEAEGEYAAKVLLHEAIHGILSEYGLDRINNERTVNVLTAGLYEFIKTNDLSFIRNGTEETEAISIDPKKVKSLVNPVQKERLNFIEDKELIIPLVSRDKPPSSDHSCESDHQPGEVESVTAAEATKRFRAIQQEESRSRQLPLLGSTPNGFSIGELLQSSLLNKEQETAVQETEEKYETELEPEHWKTGIKKENGEEYYKTYYRCPNCGHRSRRYVRLENEYVKCRECDTKIKKVEATVKGFPDRDVFGNFFNAFELCEEIE